MNSFVGFFSTPTSTLFSLPLVELGNPTKETYLIPGFINSRITLKRQRSAFLVMRSQISRRLSQDINPWSPSTWTRTMTACAYSWLSPIRTLTDSMITVSRLVLLFLYNTYLVYQLRHQTSISQTARRDPSRPG